MQDKRDDVSGAGPADGRGISDDTEAAPIVQIVKAVGIGSHEAGEFVRLTVETLTQGEVALHVGLPVVTELIGMLTAARHQAEKLQAARGGTPMRAMTAVLSFAVGAIPQLPAGVVLVLNHGDPSEQVFVIPTAEGARDVAMNLAREAENATRRAGGILPAHGMNGHGRLLGPGGRPLA